MTKISLFIIILILLAGCSDIKQIKYLGQVPPDTIAQKFVLGEFLENENNFKRSFNFTFSPNGKEVFFSYYTGPKDPKPDEYTYEIKTSHFEYENWTEPVTAAFSGEYWDVDINYSIDGERIYFASDRPHIKDGKGDIYYCEKRKTGWSEPKLVEGDVSSDFSEVYPSISKNGKLFFRSNRPGGFGNDDLYSAKLIDGKFTDVQNLGSRINTKYGESNSVIAPCETYILFCSSRPEDGGIQKIYISFQVKNDLWTKAIPLGDEINKGGAGAPTITTDGKYIFFKKKTGVYWINSRIIKKYRILETVLPEKI